MKRLSLALYQPDIPQNVGATMRLCACLGLPLHVIEPCGFPWDDRKIRQAGMDYIDQVEYRRHVSWNDFRIYSQNHRLILLTTKAEADYLDFTFQPGDILMAGRESAGVPAEIHESVDARIGIQMAGSARSLNIVNATAMIAGEALRQIRLK